MRFMPASDTALLVELDDLARTMALYRVLQAQPIAGVQELVPAARTLLVHYRPAAISPAALIRALHESNAVAERLAQGDTTPGHLVEVPVRYTGEDIPEVAELLGISVSEVIARHTGQPWQAAFAGFAPGFVYLAGGHSSFQLPRRTSPRTKVPAGSVALAGDFSAVYPSDSPGGWQLIGVTDTPMWDLQRAEPAYIQPGFRVQFIDADAPHTHVSLPSGHPAQAPVAPASESLPGDTAIEILKAGFQTLVQDAGRHGMSGLGISPSGALDASAMREANRRVGNPIDTPVLESLLGGMQLRSHGPTLVAVTGADTPLTLRSADGREWPVANHQAVALDHGDTLILGAPLAGLRSYLAVRGGWSVTPVLGSCATDTLARIGPPAIQAGQSLAVGKVVPPAQLTAAQTTEPEAARPALPRPGDTVTLDIILGPRTDWFTDEAVHTLGSQSWQVTPQSNRIGIRLAGAQPLTRSRHDELPSEGTVSGAIQVPISGQPVLFLADHPLTGGYPVIAAVASHHLDLAAQIPSGCFIRFNILPSPLPTTADTSIQPDTSQRP